MPTSHLIKPFKNKPEQLNGLQEILWEYCTLCLGYIIPWKQKFNKPNFVAAKLESLQSEKKGRKIYWWLRGEGKQGVVDGLFGNEVHISTPRSHIFVPWDQSKIQKWQLKLRGSSQTWSGVGVDMPRDARIHVTRSKGIFPQRKVYIWTQMGINFSLTTDPLPML